MNDEPAFDHDSSVPVAGRMLSYSTLEEGARTAVARPKWVYAIVAIYLLALGTMLSFPFWANWWFEADDMGPVVAICIGCFVVCGLALIMVPVRKVRRRRLGRKSIWLPLIVSGLLAGLLAYGAGTSFMAYLYGDAVSDDSFWWICIIAGFVWFFWAIIFLLIAFQGDAGKVALKLHRWLIAGSVLELLVAVPTHIIVRRHPDCCAGIFTATGICIGVVIMIISLGPGVFLLFFDRYRRLRRPESLGAAMPPPRPSPGVPGEGEKRL